MDAIKPYGWTPPVQAPQMQAQQMRMPAQGVNHQGPQNKPMQQQQNPDWYRNVMQLGQKQYLDNSAPAGGWQTAPDGMHQAARGQFESMYGDYSGGQVPQGLLGLASQNVADNNFFQKAGINPSQAMPLAQSYVGNGLGGGRMSHGGMAQFFGMQGRPQNQQQVNFGAPQQNYNTGVVPPMLGNQMQGMQPSGLGQMPMQNKVGMLGTY